MACKTDTGQDLLSIIEMLLNDVDLLRRFVQGEDSETVPLGEPIATPTPTLRHLAKNVLDAIDYFNNQWSKAADPLALDSYAFNVRRSRIMPNAVAAGSVITLPVQYYPTRDILLVMYRGEVLTPRKQDDWNPGERQYEEIYADNIPPNRNPANFASDKIKISFPLEKGSVIDCWVVASNLMKEMATLLNARDEAVEAAQVATEQAQIATAERELIEKLVGDSVLELGVANLRVSFRATKNYAAGDILELPSGCNYYPKRNLLVVTYKGQICTPRIQGQSDNYQYEEVGTDPTVRVNQIIVHFPIAKGDPLDILVWASAVGRNIDLIQALANQVQQWSSNAVDVMQSVFNKSNKYYINGTSTNKALRHLLSGEVVNSLDFASAGLPGGSADSGRIQFTDNSYLILDVDTNGQNRFSYRDAGDNILKVFYLQSTGWSVTGNWTFPKPVTVSTPLPAEVPQGPSVWDTVAAYVGTATAIDVEYNYLNKPQRSELTSVITDAQYNSTASSVYVTLSRYNALTKATSQVQRAFPIASATNSGAMPSEAYSQLSQALIDIAALKEQGGKYIGRGFATYAALQAYVIPSSVNAGDFTYVEKDETHNGATTRYICTVTGSTKKFSYAYVINDAPIGLATATSAGLVKGVAANAAKGKVFVETDGTGSVLGWNDHETRITNNATAIAGLEQAVEGVTYTAGNGAIKIDAATRKISVVVNPRSSPAFGVTNNGLSLASAGAATATADGIPGAVTLAASNNTTALNKAATPHGVATQISNTVKKTGDTMSGTLTLNNGASLNLYGLGNNQLRIIDSNSKYGLIFRNDGSNFYVLPTAKGDPLGKWSSARPFYINLATGKSIVQGTLTGNADTATKLATARTIRTNLASTSTASFDGSNNITPGVTGVLPVNNGGTGANSAANAAKNLGVAFVTKSTNTTVGSRLSVLPRIVIASSAANALTISNANADAIVLYPE